MHVKMSLKNSTAIGLYSSLCRPIVNLRRVVPSAFIRGKRTHSRGILPPLEQRAVTQLSVMSASRKQPKLLKLCREDFIKHQTIQRCWSIYQKEVREKHHEQLKLQYKSAQTAMSVLQQLSAKLFQAANISEDGKKFPMELKVPTEFPPNKIWHYTFKKDLRNKS